MALSGTFGFNPSLGDIVIGAYSRCGLRRTQLTSQHMQDAYFEANMVQSEFQGDGLQTWQVTLETQDIIAGQGVYNVDPTTVFMLDVYIRQGNASPYAAWLNANGYSVNWANNNQVVIYWTGNSTSTVTTSSTTATDRLILPMSRSEYASIANKYQGGFPTTYWYDKTLSPQLYLWPIPQATVLNGLQYYVQKRPDDAKLGNGTKVDMLYEVYDYFVWCLSERLAFIYAPDKVQLIAARKEVAYQKYLQATTENVPITISVGLRGYFR